MLSAPLPVIRRQHICGALVALSLTACGSSSSAPTDPDAVTPAPSASAANSTPTPSATPQATASPQATAANPSPSSSPTASPTPNTSAAPSPAPSANPGNPREFGEANDNQIRPGVEISSTDGSCTSNFIYHDALGNLYIGAAAHCFSPDTNSGVDSCQAQNQVMGSPIDIENATTPGELFYSSWQAMKDNSESPGSEICQANDFALVKIDAADVDNVHPSAFVFGGPTALLQGNAQVGDQVYSYGQSPFHAGLSTLQTKQGQITAQSAGGWNYSVQTDNPGLSGDSGSAVLHESGQALGVLVTVGVGFPGPVVNGVCNLDLALAYANSALDMNLQLTTADTFSP
ncbi:MAG: S1 family peptidase [Oceanococcus sp.]